MFYGRNFNYFYYCFQKQFIISTILKQQIQSTFSGQYNKKKTTHRAVFLNPNLYPNVFILLVFVYNAILVTGFGVC